MITLVNNAINEKVYELDMLENEVAKDNGPFKITILLRTLKKNASFSGS